MLDASTQTTSNAPKARAWGLNALLDGLWRTLVDLRLLLIAVGATFVSALIAVNFAQLPDQLQADPGEANRWLLAAAERSGALGELLGNIGLFNFLRSPFFQMALALIALLLLLQFAYTTGAALQLHQIARRALMEAGVAGDPVTLPPGRRIYRLRRALPAADATEPEPLQRLLAALPHSYPRSEQQTLSVATRAQPAEEAEEEQPTAVQELRVLAQRQPRAAWLKPLLPLGLLLCVACLWLLARAGWEVTVPSLAPGETFRYVAGGLELRYDVPINDATGRAAPTLVIESERAQSRLLLAPGAWTNVGGITVAVEPATTAMLVRTRGSQPLLAQPGQSTPSMAVGLIFPGPGSEQALLLPRQGAGVRIVRAADGSDSFLVELYPRNAATPEPPLRVDDMGPQLLVLEDGQVVDFLPVPSMRVTARRLPMIWLLLPALLCMAAGVMGFWLRPGFALLQSAPWSPSKQAIIVQSDRRSTVTDASALLDQATSAKE